MIKRINITIDEGLLNKIDSYSKKRYLSRSGLISLALSTYLDNVSVVQQCKRSQVASEAVRRRATLDERRLIQR